jgi:hypothetical protein
VPYYRRVGIKAEICFDEDGFDVTGLRAGHCYPDFNLLGTSHDGPPAAMTLGLEDYGLTGEAE